MDRALLQKMCLRVSMEKMTHTELKVITMLMCKLEFDDDVYFSRKEICGHLRIHSSNMSLAITRLVTRGFLVQTAKIGTVKFYRLRIPELSK